MLCRHLAACVTMMMLLDNIGARVRDRRTSKNGSDTAPTFRALAGPSAKYVAFLYS